jgi:hypothetical protein
LDFPVFKIDRVNGKITGDGNHSNDKATEYMLDGKIDYENGTFTFIENMPSIK